MLSRNPNIDHRDNVTVSSSKSCRSRSYTAHTRVTWLCWILRRSTNSSHVMRASIRTILSQDSLKATKEVTKWISATVYLFTHATVEPRQRVKLAFLWVLRGPNRLLYIHARTTPRLLCLFLPSPITMQWLSTRSRLVVVRLLILAEQLIEEGTIIRRLGLHTSRMCKLSYVSPSATLRPYKATSLATGSTLQSGS